MAAQGKLVAIRRQGDQPHPQQRRRAQLEAAPAVVQQERIEPGLLLVGRQTAPIVLGQWQRRATVNHLERLVDLLPDKRGPQHRVAIDDPLPGLGKRSRIDRTLDLPGELLDVHPRFRLGQAMEEDTRLHGGKGIDIFDLLLGAHRYDFLSMTFTSLSSCCWLSCVSGKSDGA